GKDSPRPPHRPRRHHHGQHPSLTSRNTAKPPERGPRRTVDPAARRDTPHSGTPAGRGLPAVTKNRNYPQPVKHLKPMALGHVRAHQLLQRLDSRRPNGG